MTRSAVTKQPRVITVRLSVELHEDLKRRAKEAQTSMNEYCVSRLQPTLNPEDYLSAPPAGTNGATEFEKALNPEDYRWVM